MCTADTAEETASETAPLTMAVSPCGHLCAPVCCAVSVCAAETGEETANDTAPLTIALAALMDCMDPPQQPITSQETLCQQPPTSQPAHAGQQPTQPTDAVAAGWGLSGWWLQRGGGSRNRTTVSAGLMRDVAAGLQVGSTCHDLSMHVYHVAYCMRCIHWVS